MTFNLQESGLITQGQTFYIDSFPYQVNSGTVAIIDRIIKCQEHGIPLFHAVFGSNILSCEYCDTNVEPIS